MLAMCDKHGEVYASLPGLAKQAGITLAECEMSLAKFLAPDEHSRTKENDGRRIEVIDGGWKLLNHAKYRALMSKEERREYNRLKMREWRQKMSTNVKNVNDSQSQCAMSAHTDTDTDIDTDVAQFLDVPKKLNYRRKRDTKDVFDAQVAAMKINDTVVE